MSKYLGHYAYIGYSTDYVDTGTTQDDADSATWVEVPLERIVAGRSDLGAAERLTQDNINGMPLTAGGRAPLGWAFEQHDDDPDQAWYTGLIAAENANTPTWWRIQHTGSVKEKIIGGATGTSVGVASDVMVAFGDLPVHVVTATTTGPSANGLSGVYDATLT